MIEKKIHYIWVGGGVKPNLVNICILNWKEKLSDYEIIEWNESNFNLDEEMKKNKFLKECYDRKLWAFVSDYMRVKILYEYGGIYLDTDMLVLKDLSPLLKQDFFIGKEDHKISVGIFGCKPKNKYLKKILEFYDDEIWNSNLYVITQIFTKVLEENKYFKKGMGIYEPKFFYPYHYDENFSSERITKETYTIHWWGKNWGSNKGIEFLETKHLKGVKIPLKILRIKLRKSKILRYFYEKLINLK